MAGVAAYVLVAALVLAARPVDGQTTSLCNTNCRLCQTLNSRTVFEVPDRNKIHSGRN